MAASMPPQTEDFPHLLDNFFGRMSRKMAPYLEAHEVGTMLSLASYASAAIGGSHQITTIKGSLSLHIWSILCGISGGGGKGDATKAAKEIFDKALPGWSSLHQKDGFDTGLGLTKFLDDEHRDTNGTVRNLLIFEAELSRTITQMSTDNRMIVTYTKAFDRAPLTYASGHGRIEILDPYITILGHVQPDLFVSTKKSKATAAGAWNRCLFGYVDQSQSLDLFGSLAEKKQVWKELAIELVEAFMYVADLARDKMVNDVIVPRSTADAFAKHHRPKVLALTRQSREVIQYCQRGDAYLLKLAALYALFDGRDHVLVEDFDSALAMIEYSVASVKYVLSTESEFSSRTALATRVFNHVDQHGPCTMSNMTKHIGRGNPPEAFYSALVELDGEIIIYQKPVKGRGRPNGKWLATKEQAGDIPEGSVIILASELADDGNGDQEDAAEHEGYRTAPADDEPITVERIVEPVDGEIVEEPQGPPRATLKALPAPRPPKAAAKPPRAATEPPKAPQVNGVKRGGAKVRSPRQDPQEPGVVTPPKWF